MDIVEARACDESIAEFLNTSEHAEGLIAMYIRKGFRFVEHVQWDEVNCRSVVLAKTLSRSPDEGLQTEGLDRPS
jgi:hypothetical protein